MAQQFSPEYVYQLVSSNPNLRNIVEQTAHLTQLQQQTQQQQNHNYNQWINQQPQMQQAQQPQPQQTQQPQQEENALTPQKMYDDFTGHFSTLNNNIKELYTMMELVSEAVESVKNSSVKSSKSSEEK